MLRNSVEALLHTLENHPHPVIELKLDRVTQFLSRLGNPQHRVPPVVHVAGTNGKGSVIATLKALLEAHGKSVHVYTSPHLVRFNERIVLAGKPIEDELLQGYLQRVVDASVDFPVTWFESTTAAAFLAYSEHPADVLLLEVGMGGRLDATNVVDKPVLTIITPVSYDHEAFLGNDLAAIAGEKAGIIKPDVPCVTGKQEPEAMQVILSKAKECASEIWKFDEEYAVSSMPEALEIRCKGQVYTLPYPVLAGKHQIDNLVVAFASACFLAEQGMLELEMSAVEQGISKTRWPARLQRLKHGELQLQLLPQHQLWLDGGHNAAAVEALQEWMGTRTNPIHIIFGMMQGRNPQQILLPLARAAASCTVVTIPDQATPYAAEALMEVAAEHGVNVMVSRSVLEAVRDIGATHPAPADILICGSLYLAGNVLAKNG